MSAFVTYAYDKFHNFFPHTGDGKSFTLLEGLRAHINKSHLPKRPNCRDCGYKTNNARHLKHHRDCWHDGTSQKVKKWRIKSESAPSIHMYIGKMSAHMRRGGCTQLLPKAKNNKGT